MIVKAARGRSDITSETESEPGRRKKTYSGENDQSFEREPGENGPVSGRLQITRNALSRVAVCVRRRRQTHLSRRDVVTSYRSLRAAPPRSPHPQLFSRFSLSLVADSPKRERSLASLALSRLRPFFIAL